MVFRAIQGLAGPDGLHDELPASLGDNEWQYVPDELVRTISLGPGGDGLPAPPKHRHVTNSK